MTDLLERFHSEFDDAAVPDLWDRIERLAEIESATPRPHRSRALIVAAAVVFALVLVGGPMLLLAPIDRPEPVTDTSPTDFETPALPEVDPPWGESVSAVALLGEGGIVVMTSNPDRVFWSPNRVDWFDADPDRQVTPWYRSAEESQFEDRIIVSTNSHVAIRSEGNDGVWIAAPATGQWQLVDIPSEASGERTERVLSLAASDTEVLVVTHITSLGVVSPTGAEAPESIPYVHGYGVWLIDPSDGTVDRRALPLTASEWAEAPLAIANWFNRQWLIAIQRTVWTDTVEGWETSSSIVTSSDGRSWTIAESNFPPDSVTSISVGPTAMIATRCDFGGDSVWHSADGMNWEVTTTNYHGHGSVYVDGLGYLVYDRDSYNAFSQSVNAFSLDGRRWQSPMAVRLTVDTFDGTDDPDPVDGNLFVVGGRLMHWSTNQPEDGGDATR